ncbi:MAG: alkaline phosphatase family protein [Anaerolineaceae bacterium]|nr:alkaline phosphatase family protein [Anaerolineaceae bacterium]
MTKLHRLFRTPKVGWRFAIRMIATSMLFTQLGMVIPVKAQAAQAAGSATTTPIKHLIVVMQENHTFDNYFGTYPAADGIPANTRMPVDANDPSAGFVEPFHIGNYPVIDLSHSAATFALQFDDGRMDGFVSALNSRKQNGKLAMGYYNDQDIPYYWNLADNYVLFDRLFSSARDGSFANHMYWVAAAPPASDNVRLSNGAYDKVPTIFDRLQAKGVSWKFYVQNYDPTITYRNLGPGGNRASQVVWVPLLNFDRFLDDPNLSQHIVDLNQYFVDLKNGTLPEVAYIAPSGASEHPPGSLTSGQRFIKTLIQELMRSEYWDSSAFMLLYDDWGGWYDHVVPPQVDQNGYGLRVPGILVSAYAKKGFIDNTQLDFTSILKFIEDNWGLEPLSQRDKGANNFLGAFDFIQHPRRPVFISSSRSATTPAKIVPVQIIYGFYGVALSVAAFFIAFAIIRSFFMNRRKRIARIPS